MRRGMFAIAVAGAVLAGAAQSMHGAEDAQGGPPPLKTGLAGRAAIKPLADALFAFDEEGRRNNGKAPRDGRARAERMKELSGSAKAEIRAFVSRLEANGESAAFDSYVEERASASAPTAVSELKSAGGAVAMLKKADAYIDEMVADRRKIAERDTTARWQVPGFAVVHAYSLRSTTCAAFWYVISLGYGETFAYRSCYY